MGNDVGTRVQNLETAVRNLNDALNTERKDRQAAEAQIQQELRALAELLDDNNRAAGHAIEYLSQIDASFFKKALTLQGAIRDFNDFLRLPAPSNKFLAIWDAVWAGLSLAMPLLRLTKTFNDIEAEAQAALSVASAASTSPRIMERMVVAAGKGHNIADVIRKGNSLRDKVDQAMKGRSAPVSMDGVKRLIKDLMSDSDRSHHVVNIAIDALDQEFGLRVISLLYQVPYHPKESLVDMANRLMPPFKDLSPDELEQVGRYYLWTILGQYASSGNVVIVETAYRTGTSPSIQGLNDTQQDQIMDWFGLQSNFGGGLVPPQINIWYVLAAWGVKTKQASSYGVLAGYG
jgi:hypothetical protein